MVWRSSPQAPVSTMPWGHSGEALNANHRRAEAVAAKQRFRDLVNSVEAIVWEADAQSFVFSFVSEQGERILGYPPEQWLPEPTFWRTTLTPRVATGRCSPANRPQPRNAVMILSTV
jgi:PAS domain-containing protein